MYNWSVDEKKFKNGDEIIRFFKNQPEVEEITRFNKRDRYGNLIIKVKLSPNIHPAREFYIAKYIEERASKLKVSII